MLIDSPAQVPLCWLCSQCRVFLSHLRPTGEGPAGGNSFALTRLPPSPFAGPQPCTEVPAWICSQKALHHTLHPRSAECPHCWLNIDPPRPTAWGLRSPPGPAWVCCPPPALGAERCWAGFSELLRCSEIAACPNVCLGLRGGLWSGLCCQAFAQNSDSVWST